MKNPTFLIVCALIAVTPLFRGSVHTWAQTVIQAMVALGGIVLVLEAMRSKGLWKGPSRSRDSRNTSSHGSDGLPGYGAGTGTGTGSGSSRNRKGFTTRELFLYVAGPCAVLGVWSTVMSPHQALAVQGLIMLITYLGFFFLVTAAIVMASTPVVERIITLTQGEIEDNIAHRLNRWEDTRQLIADHPAAGTGPGTFQVAYPQYQQPGYTRLSRYAHNDYLQFTADTGILFIPLMLWLLYLFFKTGFAKCKSPSRQTSGIALGCMAAVVAILIHSYSDGNLHIPANALLFTAIVAVGLRSFV